MADGRKRNINFPFKDSNVGDYIEMTEVSGDALKSNLLHLLLTNKGERLYLPDFGSDLRKFIFEPNDKITHDEIKDHINQSVKQYFSQVEITNISFENVENEQVIRVIISFTITEGAFQSQEEIDITL
jgi:phage baseplate assembly protein W|tara:strand:+ start:217 stop:600 length:384 start_codon:yes stop_codon:yes gene_type:complete